MIAFSRRHGILITGGWTCNYTGRDMADHYGLDLGKPQVFGKIYSEPVFSYRPIPAFTDPCGLNGYFQSERYFEDDADFIRSIFKPDMPAQENVCAVHVRRGDYLGLQQYHPVQSLSYYNAAVEAQKASGAEKFMVFSDDPAWCKSNLPWADEVSEGRTDLDDLALMSSCTHHIIANSSFSWWGAWLSASNNVIAPHNWFGPLGPQDTRDLIPDRWSRM